MTIIPIEASVWLLSGETRVKRKSLDIGAGQGNELLSLAIADENSSQ